MKELKSVDTVKIRRFRLSDLRDVVEVLQNVFPIMLPSPEIKRSLYLHLKFGEFGKWVNRIYRCLMYGSLKFLFASAYDWEAFVAEDLSKSKVVGVVIVYLDTDDVWFIHEIAVLPDYRGKGIGTQLMEKMISYIKGKGGEKIKLYVSADNANAIELYKKLGFTIASQRDLMILNLS